MSNTATVSPYAETPQDRAAVTALRAQRRQERATLDLESGVRLHLGSPAPLLAVAQRLGYRHEELRGAGGDTRLLLRNTEGVELTVQEDKQGLLLTSRHGVEPIQALVRAHTLEAATAFLSARCGGKVRRRERNGVVELEGEERQEGAGGQARLRVEVAADGHSLLDVDGIQGNRCETILGDYARRVAGRVTQGQKKAAYWQLPQGVGRGRVKT